MKVLISGAGGFIGRALCSRLASDDKVIGVYHKKRPINPANVVAEKADLTDCDALAAICKKHSPDVVIHCAGIAHQKMGVVDFAAYMRVNSEATENLAKIASSANPDVGFIFLSSVSVYGESPYPRGIACGFHRAGISQNDDGFDEDSECWPSSDYAVSKLHAERRLIALSDEGIICNLVILRLAPVYDREWSFNLDRRVLAPNGIAYIRFGSGSQRMSALARPNLVDFIEYLIHRLTHISADENNLCNRRNLRINVCDAKAYDFNTIIEVFKRSRIRPNRPVICVPLPPVWLATRIAGSLFPDKRNWLHSCYDKLAYDLVFDNGKMMERGFRPKHSVETIFDPQITQISADLKK
jgi:nucleoside-diphosphate-sugar epimerase